MKPYIDNYVGEDEWVREFPVDVDSEELHWHRDKKDREIEVLFGEGWMFQRDNEIPFIINTYSKFKINAMVYHRIIKGTTPLIIKIKET